SRTPSQRHCRRVHAPFLPRNELSCENRRDRLRGPFPASIAVSVSSELGTPFANAGKPKTRLRISCVHCGRPVTLVCDISLSVLATHLRRRHPREQLGAHPGEDAILPPSRSCRRTRTTNRRARSDAAR